VAPPFLTNSTVDMVGFVNPLTLEIDIEIYFLVCVLNQYISILKEKRGVILHLLLESGRHVMHT
jgi:hypothetical protein